MDKTGKETTVNETSPGFAVNARRDRILLFGTLNEQYALLTEACGFRPSCDEVVHRAVNKAITALKYLPAARREQARVWLEEHGSEDWS